LPRRQTLSEKHRLIRVLPSVRTHHNCMICYYTGGTPLLVTLDGCCDHCVAKYGFLM
jgi:hypothetical protein